jgi:DNA polymerase-3 subunit beta
MKLVAERDVLAEAVGWTARALPARPAIPVLAGMRIQAGTELALSSFDYDVSAQARFEATIEEPGSALVSGRLLAEIARSLPARPVEITSEAGRTVLSCGSVTFTLQNMPEEEYPALPEMPPAAGTVDSDVFGSAVSQAAAAAGRDDTLPTLTGVRMEFEGELLTLISTDRYRLAIRELRWAPAVPAFSAVALVPARTLADTARSLTSGAEVSIALRTPGSEGTAGDGMIGFEGGGRQSTTRLLGGEFPPVRRLLPQSVSAVAELPAGPLTEAVKRVCIVAERTMPVRLTFGTGELTLHAGAGDEAEGVEMLEAGYTGDELTVAFNPQFLMDGLSAIESDTVRFSFTEPGKAVLITGKPASDSEPDFRDLLMPIRLD